MANVNLQQGISQLKNTIDKIPAKRTLMAISTIAVGTLACSADYVTKGIITGLIILALTVGLPMSMVILGQEQDAKKAQQDLKKKD